MPEEADRRKKMKKKKAAALILALILAVPALAGCSGAGAGQSPEGTSGEIPRPNPEEVPGKRRA